MDRTHLGMIVALAACTPPSFSEPCEPSEAVEFVEALPEELDGVRSQEACVAADHGSIDGWFQYGRRDVATDRWACVARRPIATSSVVTDCTLCDFAFNEELGDVEISGPFPELCGTPPDHVELAYEVLEEGGLDVWEPRGEGWSSVCTDGCLFDGTYDAASGHVAWEDITPALYYES